MDDFYKVIEDGYLSNEYLMKYRENWKTPADNIAVLEKYATPGCSILDMGCGEGSFLCPCVLDKPYYYLGVDQCMRAVDEARKKFPTLGFQQGNFLNIDASRWLFDVIVFAYSFFHVKRADMPKVLANCKGILRDTGHILIILRNDINARYYRQSWCGQPMYWSHVGVNYVHDVAEELGFSVTTLPMESNRKYSWVILQKAEVVSNDY